MRFWKIVGVTGLGMLALPILLRGGQELDRDFRVREQTSLTRTLTFAGTGVRTLDLRAIHGSIRVTGYDGAQVELEADRTIRAEDREALRDAQREVVLDVRDKALTVEVTVRQPGTPTCGEPWNGRHDAWWDRPRYQVAFDFTARVPRDIRLQLCTINGREIAVEGTTGDFDLDNVNGRITMDGVRGSGEATTVNGSVRASFTATPSVASRFKTVNGDVVVSLPPDAMAELRLKTFHGGLFTDFETQALTRLAQPAPERRNGRFVFRSNDFTPVRIGSGGAELTLETLNGDVRVLHTAP